MENFKHKHIVDFPSLWYEGIYPIIIVTVASFFVFALSWWTNKIYQEGDKKKNSSELLVDDISAKIVLNELNVISLVINTIVFSFFCLFDILKLTSIKKTENNKNLHRATL